VRKSVLRTVKSSSRGKTRRRETPAGRGFLAGHIHGGYIQVSNPRRARDTDVRWSASTRTRCPTCFLRRCEAVNDDSGEMTCPPTRGTSLRARKEPGKETPQEIWSFTIYLPD
jgi:hypothetical protein